jgi:hypothetical protein
MSDPIFRPSNRNFQPRLHHTPMKNATVTDVSVAADCILKPCTYNTHQLPSVQECLVSPASDRAGFRQLMQRKKAVVVALRNKGLSTRNIAAKCTVISPRWYVCWKKKLAEEDTVARKVRAGARPVSTTSQDRVLK